MRNVTKNDIIDMFRKFKSAYDARYTMPKMDTVDIWYECLKDCCDEFLNQATVECVKDCEFPPTIAHIFKAHERIREKWEKERLELQDWWEVAKGIYPKDLKDDEAPKILFEKIKKIDNHEERLFFLQALSRYVHKLVEEIDADELPLLSECVKRVIADYEQEG